jgi:hypothetical protein
MLRLQLPREPTNQLLLQHVNHRPRHWARPEVVMPARLTTSHRATHTTTIVHMHAFGCGQTIDNQAPVHLLESIVPLELPQLALSSSKSLATSRNHRWATTHNSREHNINEVPMVLGAQLKHWPHLQSSSLTNRQP